MEFVISSQLLNSCVTRIDGGLGNASLAMQSVKIVADGEGVSFLTNNIRIGYQAKVEDVQVAEQGSAIVHGDTLKRFVAASSSPDIKISTSGSDFIIKDGRRKSKLTTLDSAEFNDPRTAVEYIATMPLDSVKALLGAALHTAGIDKTIFDSVYMNNKHIISTDRTKATIIPFENELEDPVLLTRDFVRELNKIDTTEDITLLSDGHFITLQLAGLADSLTMSGQLIAGDYPDMINIANQTEYPNYLSIPILEFFNELSYISLISDNKNQLCTMTVKDDGTITLTADADEGINVVDSVMDFDINASNMKEGDFIFKFQISNMVGMLKTILGYIESMNSEESMLKLYYETSDKPIKVTAAGVIQILVALIH